MELDNSENCDEIKIEFDEFSMKKEENYDTEMKFQEDSIIDTAHCSAKKEMRSIQPEGITTIGSNNYEDIKLEYYDLSYVKAENNDTHIKSEIEKNTEKVDETSDQTIRIEESDLSKEQQHSTTESDDLQSFQRDFETSNENNLTGHRNEKHLACHICDEKFSTNNSLTRHMKYVHNESLKRLSSRFGDYKKNISANVKTHINCEYLKLRKYRCHSCDFGTTKNIYLKKHIESVHLKLEKYQCHLCDYKTSQRITLKSHIDGVHFSSKKYQCPSCDYKAILKNTLKRHIESVHLKLRNYQCHLCDFKSGTKYNLKVHIQNVHLKQKNHKCHLCDFKATLRRTLKSHIDGVHFGSKNYKCDLCDYKAAMKSNLKKHFETVHLKLGNYQCHLCEHKASQMNI